MVNSTVSEAPRGTGATAASGWTGDRPRRSLVSGRRRRVPHLVVGLLLVVSCVAGVVVLSQQLSERHPVLVLARPVTAGQVLSAADVAQVMVAADAGVAMVGAERLGEMLGRPAALDLRPGMLLGEELLGLAEAPAAGEAVVALAVEPGRYPPHLQAGSSVLVVPVSSPVMPGQTAVPVPPEGGWQAVVLAVSAPGADQLGGSVLTLRLTGTAARVVAALPADAASVVLVSGRGR